MLVALAAAFVLAQAAVAAEAPAATQAPPARDPIVCKSETPIGSRLPQRSCMRKSERDRLQRESRKRLEDIQSASGGPVKTD